MTTQEITTQTNIVAIETEKLERMKREYVAQNRKFQNKDLVNCNGSACVVTRAFVSQGQIGYELRSTKHTKTGYSFDEITAPEHALIKQN
jgi:hypothetical protein